MEANMRRTGIDVIGDVQWGTHFCQFYETSQDLIEILVPYFKEGLTANEFCMWVTSEPLQVDQATAALRAAVPDLDDYVGKGQIEILDYSRWYIQSGRFSADEVLQGWVDKLKAAQERGYKGLRLTGSTFWLEKADWDDFTQYEKTVNGVIGRYPMLAICTYSLQKCNAVELLDVIVNHQFALIKRSGRWEIIESIEAKKIEQALRESEERYRELFESMDEGFALCEMIYDEAGKAVDFRYLEINPAFAKLTGLPKDRVVGRTVREVIPGIEPFWIETYSRVVQSGRSKRVDNHVAELGKHYEVYAWRSGIGRFAVVFNDITERRQSEIALQESEQRFVTTLASIGDAVIATDIRGRITFMNGVAEELTGWTLEKSLTRPAKAIFKIVNEYTRREVDDPITKVLEEGAIVGLANHTILIREDGTEIAIDDSGAPIRDRNGDITGVVLVFRDITEKKLAEKKLLKENLEIELANRILEAFVEETGNALYDKALKIVSEGLKSNHGVFGYVDEQGSLICPTMTKLYDQCNMEEKCICYTQEKWKGLWSRSLLEKKALYSNEPAVVPEGHLPVWNNLAAPILFQGKVIGLLNLANKETDYTEEDREVIEAISNRIAPVLYAWIQKEMREKEHKATDEALKESDKRMNRAQEIAHLGSWELDLLNNRLSWSDEVYRIFGLQPQEFGATYEAFLDAVHPDDRAAVDAAYSGSLREERDTYEIEHRIVRKSDGEVRVVQEKCEHIRDGSGKIIRSVGMVHDITERKQAEEELRCSRDELEQKVRDRTAELSDAKEELEMANEELRLKLVQHQKLEEDLVIAKETAEESVRAKSAFLANMSHELRTPMNAVIGFSSLLLDESLTPEQKEYIDGIRNGGESLLAIINDILDFSRSEKDAMDLESQPFSLQQCIDESLDLVAVQADHKGLDLAFAINNGTPDTIIGDHGRLRQILANLLSNAVKFTDKGGVSLSVSSKAVAGNKRQFLFVVKDTGIGIPQEKIDLLFQPFTQLERTISRKRDGVGLGLAISKKLVELMGGTIWAQSVPGQGSTFSFTFQAETIPDKQLDLAETDRRTAFEDALDLKSLRILVAEDNPSNQKVLVQMLKRMGYRADAVADGREVIEALERQPYDLVLMDVRMPEMDGITATQVIRKLQPENGPRIIAVTAYALDGDREKCLKAGMDDYISKPVKLEELKEALERFSFGQEVRD